MENFFSFYNLGLYLFILLIPTYVLLITTSIAIQKEAFKKTSLETFSIQYKSKLEMILLSVYKHYLIADKVLQKAYEFQENNF